MPAALILLSALVIASLVFQVLASRRDPAARMEARLGELVRAGERLERELREELARGRSESTVAARETREELGRSVSALRAALEMRMGEGAKAQTDSLDSFARRLGDLSKLLEERLEAVRGAVEDRLEILRVDNAKKLDEMRATVDEKLQTTLERRLADSFALVSGQLEQVHKGLGEMQALASGVGDLKRVLVNVKQRGTWGEYQLGNLLEQYLSPGQYARNVVTKPGSADRVEFAIRMPGREGGGEVFLPVDSKFPMEDYQRLVEAEDRGDPAAVAEAGAALEVRILSQAKDIRDKYLSPPDTTDFGILFLPLESLYAEVLRRDGLFEKLQRDCRVAITGPTTLTAFLNSLQMGFHTLAIEKRSSEIRDTLGAVKAELGKFGDAIDKVRKKLQEASNSVDQMGTRSRAVQRRLSGIDELPEARDAKILTGMTLPNDGVESEESDEPKSGPEA